MPGPGPYPGHRPVVGQTGPGLFGLLVDTGQAPPRVPPAYNKKQYQGGYFFSIAIFPTIFHKNNVKYCSKLGKKRVNKSVVPHSKPILFNMVRIC